jgi:four helix bundle protein
VLARLKDAAAQERGGRSQSLTRAARLRGGVDTPRARCATVHTESTTMLRIHDDMLDALRLMRPVLAAIERRDADLARQLRRAASSVVLNLAEGSGSFGRMRTARYRTALGSARETMSCLRVAEAFGYVEAMPDGLLQRLDRVVGTLVRVAA